MEMKPKFRRTSRPNSCPLCGPGIVRGFSGVFVAKERGVLLGLITNIELEIKVVKGLHIKRENLQKNKGVE
jgi:hypothetical protein